MSDDIYGNAYEAFLDEIYQNGGGEPSAVRAAVDCAVKELRAERDALRELLREAVQELVEAGQELQICSEEISGEDYNNPSVNELLARIDAALDEGQS